MAQICAAFLFFSEPLFAQSRLCLLHTQSERNRERLLKKGPARRRRATALQISGLALQMRRRLLSTQCLCVYINRISFARVPIVYAKPPILRCLRKARERDRPSSLCSRGASHYKRLFYPEVRIEAESRARGGWNKKGREDGKTEEVSESST